MNGIALPREAQFCKCLCNFSLQWPCTGVVHNKIELDVQALQKENLLANMNCCFPHTSFFIGAWENPGFAHMFQFCLFFFYSLDFRAFLFCSWLTRSQLSSCPLGDLLDQDLEVHIRNMVSLSTELRDLGFQHGQTCSECEKIAHCHSLAIFHSTRGIARNFRSEHNFLGVAMPADSRRKYKVEIVFEI